jgi:hypothetical protein
MLRETKEVVLNYAVIGLILGFFTMIIRPFISVKQTIREVLIVFCFTVLSGLLLEQWRDIINESVRTGVAGVCGFFAVRIYDILVVMFCRIKENPEIIEEKIKELRK